jgi:methionyl aminopeptidase
MSIITDPKEIEVLREGGRRLARVLRLVGEAARPGVSTDELDRLAYRLIEAGGDAPAFLNYQPPFAPRGFPSAICISVNDEVVHGIPSENPVVLNEGDIVGLDLGVRHGGLITDSAITIPVGSVDSNAQRLISATRDALARGIEAAKVGNHVGDIGHAIERVAEEQGFAVVRDLCGHGVGRAVHEEPQIPNWGKPGIGIELVSGMALALEPMFNEGKAEVVFEDDGFTVRTKDGSRSAHFEHTIYLGNDGTEIITKE